MLFAPSRPAVCSSCASTARFADVGLSKYAITGAWLPMPQFSPHARHWRRPAYSRCPTTRMRCISVAALGLPASSRRANDPPAALAVARASLGGTDRHVRLAGEILVLGNEL